MRWVVCVGISGKGRLRARQPVSEASHPLGTNTSSVCLCCQCAPAIAIACLCTTLPPCINLGSQARSHQNERFAPPHTPLVRMHAGNAAYRPPRSHACAAWVAACMRARTHARARTLALSSLILVDPLPAQAHDDAAPGHLKGNRRHCRRPLPRPCLPACQPPAAARTRPQRDGGLRVRGGRHAAGASRRGVCRLPAPRCSVLPGPGRPGARACCSQAASQALCRQALFACCAAGAHSHTHRTPRTAPRVQSVGMAKELVAEVPAAQALFARASEILGYDLLKVGAAVVRGKRPSGALLECE